MLSALLLALALQVAPDAAPQPALAVSPAAAPDADAGDIPHGAPKDDYGFVAWCRGALTGHIDLYPSVKGELEKLARDAQAMSESKMKSDAEIAKSKAYWEKELKHRAQSDEIMLDAGRDYLKLYTQALDAAEAATASNRKPYGEEQRAAGQRLWQAARGADDRQRAEVWTSWELPARCEHAAVRLRDRSLLLAGVMKPQDIAPVRTPPVDEEAPAPAGSAGGLLVSSRRDDAPRATVSEVTPAESAAKPDADAASSPTPQPADTAAAPPADTASPPASEAPADPPKLRPAIP